MRKAKPSSTAWEVALNLVALGGKPGVNEVLPPGVVDTTAELLVAAGIVGKATLHVAQARGILAVYDALDFMMPGQFEAFAHRKAFCERQVREGIAAGATQVLLLGAGYDTLAYRLAPEFPSVAFIEIDHPATSHLKARGIERLGQPRNLHLIAEDLGERAPTGALEGPGPWDQRAQSVVVAEGLLMYLPPPAPSQLFERCAAVTGEGSRIAFTYVGTRDDGRPDAGPWTKHLLWMFHAGGEPWLWSIRPEEIALFLESTGWTSDPELCRDPHRHGVEYYGVAMRRAA